MSKKPTISVHLTAVHPFFLEIPMVWEIYYANIFIDGKEIGRVKNNKTNIFQIQTGEHTLLVENTYCKSDEIAFHLAKNDNITFNIFMILPFLQQIFFPLIFFFCPNRKIGGAKLCIKPEKDVANLEQVLEYKPLEELHEECIVDNNDLEQGYDEKGYKIEINNTHNKTNAG